MGMELRLGWGALAEICTIPENGEMPHNDSQGHDKNRINKSST